MTIGERIKKIRESLGYNQRDFSKSIKIGQSTLAMLENGKREVNDRHIMLICTVYNINETWLRNGNGNMFSSFSNEERFSKNIAKIQRTDDETLIRWINAIAETNPEALKEIESFMKKILEIDG